MPDRLKLGIFMPNCSNMPSISTHKPNPDDWTFDENLRVARAAEAAGFDFLFPVSRWWGFGGETNFLGTSLETMTWASGLLVGTERIQIFSTVHVPVFNPVVAAKMGATLDHMSGGRWGINIVSGWNTSEFRMMGVDVLEHGARYQRTSDFIRILKGLWTEEPGTFDYECEWYNIRGGYVRPQPEHVPPIVNAGSSEDARNTVAELCDWAFVSPPTLEGCEEVAADFKRRAKHFGREVRCVAAVIVICRETEDEALRERDRIIRHIDWTAVNNWAKELGIQSGSFDDHTLEMLALGAGALPVIGNPEQVAEQLHRLHSEGIDGVLMSYSDYYEDTVSFGRDVVPRLRALGS